tara:strand:+ start:17057 stop:17449 length:393 start_codon:yes stop_codon:yes gene_type:complete
LSDAFLERQLEDFIWVIKESYKSSEMQKLLKSYVQGTPPEYREMLRNQEVSVYGMRIEDSTIIKANGEAASPDEVAKIESNVDKRMLTESPALGEQKLQKQGSYLFPDERELKKKAYAEIKQHKKLTQGG